MIAEMVLSVGVELYGLLVEVGARPRDDFNRGLREDYIA